MTKPPLPRVPRLSLRAKGVAALSVPMAALFVALFSIYWVEEDSRAADAAALRAYETRAELLRFEALSLDPDAPPRERERSLARIEDLARDDPASFGTIRQIRAAADAAASAIARNAGAGEIREATRDLLIRIAPLSEAQNLRLYRARTDREAARQRLFRMVIVCGIVGPLGALFVHLMIAGRLVRRLAVVEENARRLAHGLPLEPFPAGSDEIAALGRQLEEAAARLSARERELRESEGRYRDLFDKAPVPYEETDRDGVIRRFNQALCSLLRRPADQIIGARAWDFVAPEQRDPARVAMLRRIAEAEEAKPFECAYEAPDGTRIVVEVRETLMRNDAGEAVGVCRSLVDVTERNQAAAAARKVAQFAMELGNRNEQLGQALEVARSATEAKSRFLANVSHELRTPLNGIIGFSEILHDGKLGPLTEDQREVIGDILSSASHLLNLISDILDLSKVEAGRMEFHPEPCAVEPLVREVRDVIRPLADRKRIRLSTEAPEGYEAVLDRARFKQILYNYLSNAVKFTPEGGRIEARIVPDGEWFRLEVEDSGIGIAPEEISKLFQDFQQLASGQGSGPGTGLGLALTRRIVEAQGGSVGVRSTPGAGSLFTATLPKKGVAERAVS